MRRVLVVLALSISVVAVEASSAGAATQVGQTFTPAPFCSSGYTWLQAEYSVPSDGVITNWQYQAGLDGAPQLKFKVGRLVSGNIYSIVGESDTVTPVASALNQYPIRIPVKTGDLIGFYTVTDGGCDQPNPAFTELTNQSDLATGAQAPFSGAPYEMDVAASVEPDADHDGFGDETQDQCSTNAGTQGACPAIKKKKCKKHKKGKRSAELAKKKKCKKKKRK
jgi:hypothetical protein